MWSCRFKHGQELKEAEKMNQIGLKVSKIDTGVSKQGFKEGLNLG